MTESIEINVKLVVNHGIDVVCVEGWGHGYTRTAQSINLTNTDRETIFEALQSFVTELKERQVCDRTIISPIAPRPDSKIQ